MRSARVRRTITFLSLALLLFSSGCVYLRLLKTKRQMSSFNKYFELNDDHGLTIVFKKPVLLEKDILWLMRYHPVSNRKTPQGVRWYYVYAKLYRDEGTRSVENGQYDIPISVLFTEGKLKELTLPGRFLKAVSLPLLRSMLQSLGEAKVRKSKRSATSKFKVDTKFELPTEAQIFMVLGKPYSVHESTKGDTLRYKFTRGGVPNGSRRGPTIIEMRFIVAKEARKVKRGSVFIRGLKLNIDFTSD